MYIMYMYIYGRRCAVGVLSGAPFHPFPRGDLKYIDIYRCMLSHAYLYKLLFVYRFFVCCLSIVNIQIRYWISL